MMRSPVAVKTSQSPSRESRTCCSGKKVMSYSCKVRCMAAVCFVLVAAAAALIYFLLTKKPVTQERILALPKKLNWSPQCPTKLLKFEERFDCYPEDCYIDKLACEARGCCYLGRPDTTNDIPGNATVPDKVPKCVYPQNYGYATDGKAEVIFNGFEVPLRRLPAPSRYGDDIQLVHMRVEMQTKYRLRIKFYDPEYSRYEVPVPKVPTHSAVQTVEQNGREVFLYSVTYNTVSSPFAVKVRRSSTDAIVFDTSAGALILSNQFLELTTKLPSPNVFGLGQQLRAQYHHDFDWRKFTLFSSKLEVGNATSGAHPFYLCMENDGNAHGVFLLNSNAVEIQLHPSPAVTFRAIGGVLDFYLFLGPTPEEVVQQYTEAVGRPMLPPYWSLGLHVGRAEFLSTSDIEDFVKGFRSKYIPVETLILSQDVIQSYMFESEGFWNLSNFTSKWLSKNQRIVIYSDCGILKTLVNNRDSVYSTGSQSEIFVTDKWGLHPIIGQRGGKQVVYPDYGSSSAIVWWTDVLKKMNIALKYDGVWLANNEPLNNVDGSSVRCFSDNLNNPPYKPGFSGHNLYENTLCMDALLHWRDDVFTHYDYHNFYGHSMAVATEQALSFNFPKKRKLILSDSTFAGTGQFAGHWIKDLGNGWEYLRYSIPAVMELGLYGIAIAGASVFGSEASQQYKMSEELSTRWIQLGAFFPFFQVYGKKADYLHNAGHFGKDFMHAARSAISRRYELLPYLYTLFYLAHTKGSTVMRPLFHEFPFDNETYSISSQFMWGPALLISPIMEEGVVALSFYIPEGVWYNFYQGSSVHSSGEWFTETGGPFEDAKQPVVLHLRAGHIITLQKPSDTTTTSRQNSMSLLVALDESSEARGLLFWDDGETKNSHLLGEYILVDYVANGSSLVVTGNSGKKVFMSSFYGALIQQVRIMGLPKPPKRIVIDGGYILSNKQYHWNYDYKVLDLKHILIPLARRTEVQWFF